MVISMKKTLFIIALIIICTLVIALLNPKYEKKDRINITTSFYPMYTIVLNLTSGIEGVEVNNLTNDTTGCVHDYVLSPQELVKVSKSDILIVNGSGMETFISKVLAQTPQLNIIDSSIGVEHEYVIHNGHEEIDPHTYLNIDNYILQVKNIAAGLIEHDPMYKEKYEENLSIYLDKLNLLKNFATEKLKDLDLQVISQANSFKYFARSVGIEVVDVLEKEEGQALSFQEMSKIVDCVNKLGVKILVSDKDLTSQATSAILQETSLKDCKFDKVISSSNEKDNYLNIMTRNIEAIYSVAKELKDGQV